MQGIDLNQSITFIDASMRYFKKDERHITRTEPSNVLVMVYDGILRFSEDGVEYEVAPGQYHIQRANTYQRGDIASDMPKYLYVHFLASWGDGTGTLAKRGEFNCQLFRSYMEELARTARGNATKTEITARFFEIISMLYNQERGKSVANDIADFICEHYKGGISLEDISERFNFSKNHIINIFKKEFGITPFAYINNLRIKEAERLLEVTGYSLDNIAYESGFGDYSQFYKAFRLKNDESPKKWRQRRQG